MKRPHEQRIGAPMAILIAGVAQACSPLQREMTPEQPFVQRGAPVAAVRIAQLGFGPDARFAGCVDIVCPRPTPKTISLSRAGPTTATTVPATSVGPTPPLPASEPESRRERLVVHFVSGKATLSDEGRAKLHRSLALARSSRRIVISGRTDWTGSGAVNDALALARAHTVRDYLAAHGSARPDHVSIDARGGCCFVADNASADGRQMNRRVEIDFDLDANVQS